LQSSQLASQSSPSQVYHFANTFDKDAMQMLFLSLVTSNIKKLTVMPENSQH
jgi:hypothetical protein